MQSQDQSSLSSKIISAVNSLDQITNVKMREELISLINELINEDFQSLIQLLYRIDVNEKKIRLYLEENSDKDAASVLADLIIERQLQKIESRKKYTYKNNADDHDEKW
jgi:hypothetical protein